MRVTLLGNEAGAFEERHLRMPTDLQRESAEKVPAQRTDEGNGAD